MKTRAEIKAIARGNFQANYWPTVGITFLMLLIIGALSCTGVGFILIPVLSVGLVFFYIASFFGDRTNANLSNIFNVGFARFGRNLGSMILKSLLLFAWTMLFVIPGIIKSFSYAMTSFILADCPEVGAVDAITISRRMMKGHKWEYFVFNLSFIGWQLLSSLTGGLLGIFYVTPYQSISRAGYYAELKKNAIAEGRVTAEQFAGQPLDGSNKGTAYDPNGTRSAYDGTSSESYTDSVDSVYPDVVDNTFEAVETAETVESTVVEE